MAAIVLQAEIECPQPAECKPAAQALTEIIVGLIQSHITRSVVPCI